VSPHRAGLNTIARTDRRHRTGCPSATSGPNRPCPNCRIELRLPVAGRQRLPLSGNCASSVRGWPWRPACS